MKKMRLSKPVSHKTKKPLKGGYTHGLKVEQPLESKANAYEPITIPTRKRFSLAADEEME